MTRKDDAESALDIYGAMGPTAAKNQNDAKVNMMEYVEQNVSIDRESTSNKQMNAVPDLVRAY